MAKNTRNQILLRATEERLSSKLDKRFLEFACSLRQTLCEDMDELLQQWATGHSPSSNARIVTRGEKSSTYSCYTCLARLDFPKFNGYGIKNWLVQCETFFSVDNTPEDFKVRLAVVHFEGKALQWHNAYVRIVGLGNLPSWKDYSQILLDRFGEVCEDPMAELMRLGRKDL